MNLEEYINSNSSGRAFKYYSDDLVGRYDILIVDKIEDWDKALKKLNNEGAIFITDIVLFYNLMKRRAPVIMTGPELMLYLPIDEPNDFLKLDDFEYLSNEECLKRIKDYSDNANKMIWSPMRFVSHIYYNRFNPYRFLAPLH